MAQVSTLRGKDVAAASHATPRPSSALRASRGEISIVDVGMRFTSTGSKVQALDDISLAVRPGEFIALLGPSGCGKSTLLNLIGGILKPSTGTVSIDGCEVVKPNPTCNVVFQQHSLFPWMSVFENVAFGPRMLGHASPDAVARTFLSIVGLEAFKDAYPATLSGGMQQRVAIARALATYPPVLLMDEPFGALDAQTRSIMQDELQRIWSQFRSTVVFVTHDVNEAICLADRILVMSTMPGGIKDDISVALPRPRSRAVMASDGFHTIREQIITLLREESFKVFNRCEEPSPSQ